MTTTIPHNDSVDFKHNDNQQLIHLIYGSTAVRAWDNQQLLDLLAVSRRNNQQRAITGMLVYHDCSFLQILEGNHNDVMTVFDQIRQDARHRFIKVFRQGRIVERDFSEWMMGFANLHTFTPSNVAGYSDILKQPLATFFERGNASYAYSFLKAFKYCMQF